MKKEMTTQPRGSDSSALFGRVSKLAAIKAIFTGAAVMAAVPDVPDGQRYYIAIDPASDVPDHYVEGIFRVDEHSTTLISMKRFPNADALRPNQEISDG